MKLLIFVVFFVVFLLSAIAAKPVPIESSEEVEMDPPKLHRAIKNVAKIQRALKAVEAKYEAQQRKETPHKSIGRKSFGKGVENVGKGVVEHLRIFEKFFSL